LRTVLVTVPPDSTRTKFSKSLNPEPYSMKGFLNFFGMSVGGWIGWAIGAQVSIFTAFMVSMVGSGVGLFYSQRAIRRLLP